LIIEANSTYGCRSLPARKPQPLLSVKMTSKSACCFIWKRRLEQYAPFKHREELERTRKRKKKYV